MIQSAPTDHLTTSMDCSVDAGQTHAPEAAGARPSASKSWHPTQIEGSWHKLAKMRPPAVGRCVHGIDTSTFLEHASPTAPTSAPPGCQTHRRNAIFGGSWSRFCQLFSQMAPSPEVDLHGTQLQGGKTSTNLLNISNTLRRRPIAPLLTRPSPLTLEYALSDHSPAKSVVQNPQALTAPCPFPNAEIPRKRILTSFSVIYPIFRPLSYETVILIVTLQK